MIIITIIVQIRLIIINIMTLIMMMMINMVQLFTKFILTAADESYISLANGSVPEEGLYDNPATYLTTSSINKPSAKVTSRSKF
jgi:hypothetical protein